MGVLQKRWVLMTASVMSLINTTGGEVNHDGSATDDGNATYYSSSVSFNETRDCNCTTVESGTGSGGTSTAVIVCAALLCALVLANVACAAWCVRRRHKTPPARLPLHRSGTNELELETLRKRVETEQSRRKVAEAGMATEREQREHYAALVVRSKAGGIRPNSEFPSVRAVLRDVKHQLVDDVLQWAEQVFAVGGSRTGLTAVMRAVLEHTFNVCREEATRCLNERLRAFKQCLGKDELISLSGDNSMNLDTEYVLYECLCRNYQTIVSTNPDKMRDIAATIVRRCDGHQDLAGNITFGDTWRSFHALTKHYLHVFVAMGLQKPPMGFKDGDLGRSTTFEESLHRDWAPSPNAPVGQQCTIVFPSIVLEGGRVSTDAKIGVVRVPL